MNATILNKEELRQPYPLKGNRWQRRLNAMRASAQNWSFYREVDAQIADARAKLRSQWDAFRQTLPNN
jgi:hypothetical protein